MRAGVRACVRACVRVCVCEARRRGFSPGTPVSSPPSSVKKVKLK